MLPNSDDNKQKRIFPLVCGLAIGSMPALLWLPIIGRLMFWLLRNSYFLLFFVFTNYLPWMIGSLIGRFIGMPVFIPILFCLFYWVFLGSMAGEPKYSKAAIVYIATAHILIPLVFFLVFVIYPPRYASFPLLELEQLIRMNF